MGEAKTCRQCGKALSGELMGLCPECLLKADTGGRPPETRARHPSFAHWEYRSERMLFGLPLLHVAITSDPATGRPPHARGTIAVGGSASGVIALGGHAIGVVAFGGIAVGVLSMGGLTVGLLSMGGLAIAPGAAIGGVVIAPIALGGMAIGYYAVGGSAIGAHTISGKSTDQGQPFDPGVLTTVVTVILASVMCVYWLIVGLAKMRTMRQAGLANRVGAPRYWFPAKRYGWGWGFPNTWQGWAFLVPWMVVTISLVTWLASMGDAFLPVSIAVVLVAVALLILVCFLKGEPPRWRWGDKEDS